MYDTFIGLGGSCQTAHQLNVNKLKGPTLPFDWVVSPFSSVHALIQNEFADWLDKEHLVLAQDDEVGWYIHDQKYRIRFLHDFPLDPEFVRGYDVARSKYERRIRRLLELLQSDKRVLFVRLDITREEATAFDRMLRKKFPRLKYDLLAVGDTPEMQPNWELPRIRNLFLPQPESRFWAGLDEPWREVLGNVLNAPADGDLAAAPLLARLEPQRKRLVLRRGETKTLAIRVINESRVPLGFGPADVGLSYHLLSHDGRLLQWDHERARFTPALQSGEARELQLAIAAPREPGTYQAELDVVWEGVTWLKEKGSPTSLVQLTVL